MTIIYITHAVQIIAKKNGGYSCKQVIYGSHTDPSDAYQQACSIIDIVFKKEDYFTEKPVKSGKSGKTGNSNNKSPNDNDDDSGSLRVKTEFAKRKQRVKEIMSNQDPSAGKYYDLDNLMSKWAPSIPELSSKKYDIRVSESELQ